MKNVSVLNALALNVMAMAAGAALGSLGLTMVLLPSVDGLNLVYSASFALLLSIPVAILYVVRTRKMPRTGGDYIWLSRSFGGLVGNAGLSALVIGLLSFLALITLSAVFSIGSVGVSLGYPQFLSLALPGGTPGADPTLQVIVALVIFSALIAINVLRPRAAYRLVSTFMIIGIIAWLLAIGSLLVAGKSGIIGFMDVLNGAGANATYASVAASYSGSAFNPVTTLSFLPFFGIFVLLGINTVSAVGSELKRKRASDWGIPLSIVVTYAIFIVSFATMYYAGGLDFINSAMSNPTLVYNYSLNFWTLSMGVSPYASLAWIIGLGWIVWGIGIIGYGIIYFSRALFAQAFDRVLPSKLAYVSQKYSSPVVIHLIDLALTLILVGIAAFYYQSFVGLYGVSIGALIYYVIVGIASAAYALSRNTQTNRAIIFSTGIITAVVFAFFAYEFIVSPVWGASEGGYFYALGAAIFGGAAYIISSAYHRRKRIDISLVFKEIPPE